MEYSFKIGIHVEFEKKNLSEVSKQFESSQTFNE